MKQSQLTETLLIHDRIKVSKLPRLLDSHPPQRRTWDLGNNHYTAVRQHLNRGLANESRKSHWHTATLLSPTRAALNSCNRDCVAHKA